MGTHEDTKEGRAAGSSTRRSRSGRQAGGRARIAILAGTSFAYACHISCTKTAIIKLNVGRGKTERKLLDLSTIIMPGTFV